MSKSPLLPSTPVTPDSLLEASLANAKLSVPHAAAHLGVSKSWLDKKRLYGDGPRYIKLGRRVLYDLADLEAYSARMKRLHTSEDIAGDC
jgi:predicted DNA-binding transcriptional regulator AlpA